MLCSLDIKVSLYSDASGNVATWDRISHPKVAGINDKDWKIWSNTIFLVKRKMLHEQVEPLAQDDSSECHKAQTDDCALPFKVLDHAALAQFLRPLSEGCVVAVKLGLLVRLAWLGQGGAEQE